jgi:hypothetical protein
MDVQLEAKPLPPDTGNRGPHENKNRLQTRERHCKTKHAGHTTPLKVHGFDIKMSRKRISTTNCSQTCPSSGWAIILRKFKESITTPVDARAVKGAGATVAAGVVGRDKSFIQVTS